MDSGTHEVFAIRYGMCESTTRENFIASGRSTDRPMPLDYFVWLICASDGRRILVDTGFDAALAMRRGATLLRKPQEGLARLGIRPDEIDDIVITHLHYDHAGDTKSYPKAKIWLQEREMQFATSKYMCQSFFKLAYEKETMLQMVGELFDGRIAFVDREFELAPGISLHWVGGHTAGLQVVRVKTKAGWVVLASDLFHFYENFESQNLFPILYRPDQMLEAFGRIIELATDPSLIIPGHDPLVMKRFEQETKDAEFTVRLWRPI